MTSELLGRGAGMAWNHVPYRSYGAIAPDLIAGRLDAVIADLTTFGPLVQAGQARVLAAATAERSAFLPEAPGMAELGFPGFDGSIWFGLFAPTALAAEVPRLNAALHAWQAEAQTTRALAAIGQVPAGSTPDELGALIRADAARFGPLIRDLGITAE
jgi:tripartite-type tricarboxylate transporter receptor subunit TctC